VIRVSRVLLPFIPHTLATAGPVSLPSGLEWLSDEHHAASNSWVISGARTASGRPLLANDPHLAIEMPSVWWEVHVSAEAGAPEPSLNVTGVTIPGIPFVLIGHNDRIGGVSPTPAPTCRISTSNVSMQRGSAT
jgi:acyl-homoserine lactone acylase PvdQ